MSTTRNANSSSWGVGTSPVSSTFGQTVTTPALNRWLASFSFQLGYRTGGSGDIQYKAYVYAWDTTNIRITGASLWSSSLQTYTPPTSVAGTFNTVTFHPDVQLVAGGRYVLFLSTADLQSGRPVSSITWGLTTPGTYSGGGAFARGGSTSTSWTSGAWAQGSSDFAFSATFAATASPVPEPSFYALVSVGLAGLFFARRRCN